MKTCLAIIFVLGLVLGSCTRDKGELEVICNTPALVSFNTDIKPIFSQHCIDAGCHSGANPAAGLNLNPSHAYANLNASGTGYIDTINPKFSVLYAEMNSVSSPMPPNGKLDPCTLQLVLRWIEQKAKNN
jgi:hypothetical protein